MSQLPDNYMSLLKGENLIYRVDHTMHVNCGPKAIYDQTMMLDQKLHIAFNALHKKLDSMNKRLDELEKLQSKNNS